MGKINYIDFINEINKNLISIQNKDKIVNILKGRKILINDSLNISNFKNELRIFCELDEIKIEVDFNNFINICKANRIFTLRNICFKDENFNLNTIIILENIKIDNLIINQASSEGKLTINNIENKDSKIEFNNILDSTSINIISNKIESIKINNYISSGKLSFNVSNIKEFVIKDSNFNSGYNSINKALINDFNIINTDLGTFIFNGLEIIKFGFYHSSINNIQSNNVIFPNKFKNVVYGNKLSTSDIKDYYRQFKYFYDKNNNYTEGNKFYALEMEEHMKYLLGKKNNNFSDLLHNNFFGEESKNIGNKITLLFGYHINEFGTNLSRNLFSIYLYLLLVVILVFSSSLLFQILFNTYNQILILHNVPDIILNKIYEFSDIFSFFIIYIIIRYDNKIKNNIFNKIYNSKKYSNIFFTTTLILIFIIGLINFNDFNGFKTISYLINPFSGLTDKSMLNLLWTEQLGMILHKIIYGTLIYHLIIALKRTTKR